MKLYTHALSPFSAKVRVALAEKGVRTDEERLPITRTAIAHEPKQLLDANPRGQVPTLVDGDLVLYDSTVMSGWRSASRSPRSCPRAWTTAPGRASSRTTRTG